MTGAWQPGSGYPPPPRPPDTGERLRAALHARSGSVDQGWSPGWDGGGYSGTSRGSPRPPLLPRWGKVLIAVVLLLSAGVGAGLGLRAHDSADSSGKLPPARETSYGKNRARVAITGLTRRDKFVTLEIELTNLAPLGSDDDWSVNNALGESSGYDLSGIRLLDPTSAASYRPAEDAAKECLCTRTISLTIAAGSSTRVSAQFPAPAPAVKKMDVDIPGAGSFEDVPLA